MSEKMNKVNYDIHTTLGLECSSDGLVHLPASKNGRWKDRWVKGTRNKAGYRVINYNGKVLCVHRIIAETFLTGDGIVDHINRDKSDNNIANLRFGSISDNMRNTNRYDRVSDECRTHWCEDKRQYFKEYAERHRSHLREYHKQYYLLHKQGGDACPNN